MENSIPEFGKQSAIDAIQENRRRLDEVDAEIQRIRKISLASPELDPLIREAQKLNLEYLRLKEQENHG